MKIKALLYCCKAKPYLYKTEDTTYPAYPIGYHTDKYLKVKLSNTNELANLNGKIVAECDYEVEEINYRSAKFVCNRYYLRVLDKSCLTDKQMYDYLKGKNGYAIHIKNLHIFDEPKELNEVYKIEDVGGMLFTKPLTKAPQNMMRVSVNHWDYATYNPDDIRVLISIKPEWLCKILNKEKTIEVRKKVLKEMLSND